MRMELYKGQAGSPITYLAADISANQTTISIADDSALPDAPNICTIGYGEHLETIKYETKSNGVLQNVTRGIEGTPQAWQAGTEVARFFTAYDHNSIIDNFVAHKAEKASVDNVHGLRNAQIALGENSVASGVRSIAIGRGSQVARSNSISIGNVASVVGQNTIAIGSEASAADAFGSAAIGGQAKVEAGGYNMALGYGAKVSNAYEGILGVPTSGYGPRHIIVPGNFTVNGTKNFEIPHPKPSKKDTHRIRHAAVESPTEGDTLYRYKISADKDNDLVIINLPDYFIWLNKDVQIFVTGQGHFGNGYGELNKESEHLEIHCQFKGEYNVLVVGTRKDDNVQDWSIKGVEREVGESWLGETYVIADEEIISYEEVL